MVTSKKFSIAFILIGFSAGCAPLEQAPLVYSSKSVVGVDLSATATEQPGLSVNIGYKQVDAAYVPVAVAKSCDYESNQKISSTKNLDGSLGDDAENDKALEKNTPEVDCTNPIYALLQIAGNNNVADSRNDNESMEEAKKRLEVFKGLGAARDNAAKSLSDAQTKKNQVENSVTLFKEKYPDIETNQTLDGQIKSEYDAKQAELKALTNAEESARASLKSAELAVTSFDISKLLNAFNIAGQDNNKKDAYSVFGSFDANTKAVSEVEGKTTDTGKIKGDTGLVLGKVFSTGVASQNLTEGMRKYYEYDGKARIETAKSPSNCLTRSLEYLEGFEAQLDQENELDRQRSGKMYEDLLALCKSLTSNLHNHTAQTER